MDDGASSISKHILIYAYCATSFSNLINACAIPLLACADPESFVRGGSTLIRGEMIQIPLKADHRSAI